MDRRGMMPGFEGKLKPEEMKAVSVYVLSRAATQVKRGRGLGTLAQSRCVSWVYVMIAPRGPRHSCGSPR
jgi:hypothetical protein